MSRSENFRRSITAYLLKALNLAKQTQNENLKATKTQCYRRLKTKHFYDNNFWQFKESI